MLDEVAKRWKGIVKVVKINVMNNPQIAQRFQIRGVPTLILMKDSVIIHQVAGALPFEQINAFIKRAIES